MATPEPTGIECPLIGCLWSCEGVRPMDDYSTLRRITEVLGVGTSFYTQQWQVNEMQRIEKDLERHMKNHTVVEMLTTIRLLKDQLHNLEDSIPHHSACIMYGDDAQCDRCNR